MGNQMLFQAIAELAYSISMADGELQSEEKNTFINLMEEEFSSESWWAINRFKLLESQEPKNIEQCYQFAIFALKTNRSEFTEKMREKFLRIIEDIANSVNGLDENELKVINRFKEDLTHI